MNYMHRMHSNSGMAGLHAASFGYLVLGLAGIICGVSSSRTCTPQPLTSPHSVHAYTDQARQCLAGCISTASADTSVPEVHVINIRPATPTASTTSSSADSESNNPQGVVDFHFEPIYSKFYGRSLVFFLNSATPVRWRVDGKGTFFMHTVKIVVPAHSCNSVTWNSEISPSVSVECLPLPQHNSDLLSFVHQQYSNVSTFSEVLSANSISLLVGSAIKSPHSCLIQPDFQTPDFTARYVVEQPVAGCQSADPIVPLQPEFHVILLEGGTGSPATGTGQQPSLTVDVQVGSSADSICDVVLVLVSEANVTWRIRAGGRRGLLEVKSPNAVTMRENQMNHLEKLELPRSTEELIAWAETKDWPLTTFTRATGANKFVVTLERRVEPTRDPPSRMSIIERYTEVDCLYDGIRVRVQSSVMATYKLTADNMMLRDHACKAVEEGDYYVIHTQWDQCGTTKTEMEMEREAYHNEVIFSNSESVLEGSGSSDLHVERLMGVLPVDDEQSLTARVPFTCEYNADGEPLTGDLMGPGRSQVTITMEMFTSNSFAQIETTFPHTVQTGERVYFEVALVDNAQLHVMTSQCWLATGLKARTGQLHMLIYKGCANDDSLIFHRGTLRSGQSQRFSYEVPDIQWEALYYVHCELGLCSTDGTGSNRGIPLCSSIMDPDTGCLMVNFPTSSLYIGPFKTTTPSLATPDEGNFITRGVGDSYEQTGYEECEGEGLRTGPAVAIAVASFVMGMVLIGALWCIHTHTGPHTGPPPSASPCTVSTASSPSANGHLMNGHIPNGALPNGPLPPGPLPHGPLPHGPLPPCALANGHIPGSGFLGNRLNPNSIPLQGMRHVDHLPEDV